MPSGREPGHVHPGRRVAPALLAPVPDHGVRAGREAPRGERPHQAAGHVVDPERHRPRLRQVEGERRHRTEGVRPARVEDGNLVITFQDFRPGVPEKTAVTVRIVSRLGGVDYPTKEYQGTTGALPSGLPRPRLLSYDATLATPEGWIIY